MGTILVIILFLGLWHLFYEYVIAASLRHEVRYKFFAVRDKLRLMKINGLTKDETRICNEMDVAACDMLSDMQYINIFNSFKVHKLSKKHPEVQEIIAEREDVLKSLNNPELLNADLKLRNASFYTFLINSGGWFIYLLPPIVLIVILGYLISKVSKLKKRILAFIMNISVVTMINRLDDDGHSYA